MVKCGHCGKVLGTNENDMFFNLGTFTPKYWHVNQKTKEKEHYFCDAQCSLNWHEANIRNKP